MVRVCTAAICVLKMSMPSRKNGRFSSKKIGNRWLAVTTNWSDSTCAKSGFRVKSRVMVGVSVYLPVSPGSSFTGSFTKRPGLGVPASALNGSADFRLPVSDTVKLGISSNVLSVERPSRPARCPSWANQLFLSRSSGIHISSELFNRLVRRQKCMPHNLSLPAT